MRYVTEIRNAIANEMERDRNVLVCGQLVSYGTAGVTTGLKEKFPKQVITYPVSESLMNSSAMGLAMAGKRPIMIHERMDFIASGMDALVNHIPIWPVKCHVDLPLIIFCIVGFGHGQGPQHSKNLGHWFRSFEGWKVIEPTCAVEAGPAMREAFAHRNPVMFVAHRILFNSDLLRENYRLFSADRVALVGAAECFEQEFLHDSKGGNGTSG